MQHQLDPLIKTLSGDFSLYSDSLSLDVDGCLINIRSNCSELLQKLARYFAHVRCNHSKADIDIIAIERAPLELELDFIDWQREPGKTGRKDSYVELPQARLLRKVRTGMVFLQSASHRIAAGPCLQYDNQLINFINSQYMNWLQQRGWLICHASALARAGRAVAIAGLSGGGKSTLMLQLLETPDINFLTNDRLFINDQGHGITAAGIPKLPRINPGTIVHNPRLHPLLPEARREELLALPTAELWRLEQKHDVFIDDLYGKNRITQRARLTAFVVLNWQLDSREPAKLEPAILPERSDLLGAIMKSPGPFYQYADGAFYQDGTALDSEAYLDMLNDIPVYEISGRLDFNAINPRLGDLLS